MPEESPFKGQTGLRRLWNALQYSRAGLRAAYIAEDAFRQEALLAALLIPLSLSFSPSGLGTALMIGSVLLVLIVELLNSAIEATVDRISLAQRLAKRARASAVLRCCWPCSTFSLFGSVFCSFEARRCERIRPGSQAVDQLALRSPDRAFRRRGADA